MYDPELPAGYQDADIEMAEWADESAHIARLRRNGICTHQSSLGTGDGRGPLEGGAYYPEQIGMTAGQQRCTDLCGELFDSDDAMFADGYAASR